MNDFSWFSFAAGKSTALVVESGASVTSVTPVYDGFYLKKGSQKQFLAGDFVSDQAYLYLKQANIDLVPQYQVIHKESVEADQPANYKKSNLTQVHPTMHRHALLQSIHDFKETVCHTLEVPYDKK
jgi:actin-related protein